MMSENRERAVLVLECGEIFEGVSIGKTGVSVGEIVIHTSHTGYQEILTDPSYADQIITFTYPHIGNTGINHLDSESNKIWSSGVVFREVPTSPSNWQSEGSLYEFLIKNHMVGIAEIDTRYLTQIIREKGMQTACIIAGSNINLEDALRKAKHYSYLDKNFLKKVSTASPYIWKTSDSGKSSNFLHIENSLDLHVVVYDFGIKRSILNLLTSYGFSVTVVPYNTSIEQLFSLEPAGILLSNGPGNPVHRIEVIDRVKQLLRFNIPLFGICFGYQMIGLASGASIEKMKFGHHGANHPVKYLKTGKVFVTSQNHGYHLSEKNFPKNLIITHRSLFDNTIQGIERTDVPASGFQGHPEGSPGPSEMRHLFDQFALQMLRRANKVI